MSTAQDLSLVFAAGVFATFNPCGFAMLPAYITILISGQTQSVKPRIMLARAIQFSLLIALGIVSVFALFAVAIFPFTTAIQRFLPVVTVLIGSLLVTLGVLSLLGKSVYLRRLWSPNVAPTRRVRNIYLYGVTFALGSLSCTIGPFLAATSKALNLKFLEVLRTYLFYALGISATIFVIALFALFSKSAINKVRNSVKIIETISNVFLVFVGLYLIIFGVYETQFSHFVEPLKNLIDKAFALQGEVIGLVNDLLQRIGVLKAN